MLSDRLFSLFSHDVGIDLGTANTLLNVVGKGVMVREPSVVARHMRTKAVLAVGSEAKRMLGKNPDSIEVVRPLKDGVIADYDAAEAMLSFYIKEIHLGKSGFLPSVARPRVAVGVPSGITEVEARAVQDAALSAGARKAFLLEEPMAAAIGAGIAVLEPEGRMIVDIGGGTTEIAVISLGGIVVNRSIRVAGDEFDSAIVSFARMKYGLVIGQPTAEEVKLEIGSAAPFENKKSEKGESRKPKYYVVRGRDLATGLPKSVKFSSGEIREALAPIVRQIVAGIIDTLEETPPELVSDILEHGIVLSGGTTQLRKFDEVVAEETKMQVHRVDQPQLSVARGTAKALADEKLLERVKIVGGVR